VLAGLTGWKLGWAAVCAALPACVLQHLTIFIKAASIQGSSSRSVCRMAISVSDERRVKVSIADPCQHCMPSPCDTRSACAAMRRGHPAFVACKVEMKLEAAHLLKAFLHKSSSSSVSFTAILAAAAFPLHELRAAPRTINQGRNYIILTSTMTAELNTVVKAAVKMWRCVLSLFDRPADSFDPTLFKKIT
jgi:hypothetical protein